MALTSAMFSAANGLQAHSEAMNVVSDNIANLSTTGFKQNQARFFDVMSNTVADAAAGKTQGQGSMLGYIQANFSQGTMIPTGRPTDLAVQGDGFFVVNGAYEGTAGNYYTRDGGFHLNAEGSLVNAQDLHVQGYMADKNGVMQTQISDMQVGGMSLVPPHATEKMTIKANLDSEAPVVTFDINEPNSTSTFGTSVTLFDSRGAARNVDLYLCNNGGNNYTWYALIDGSEVAGGTKGTNQQVGTGTMKFDNDGWLVSPSSDSMTIDFANAEPGQKIKVTFGDAIADGGTGQDGLTAYAGKSNISFLEQDGYSEGALVGVAVSDDGAVTGSFNNGVQRYLGTVAVANFVNQEGLGRAGGTLFVANLDSGLPAIGPPGVGGRGNVVSGSLEQSNVNLSTEFVNLLQYQRGFEANTRSIKAADQMLQELVNLTR